MTDEEKLLANILRYVFEEEREYVKEQIKLFVDSTLEEKK